MEKIRIDINDEEDILRKFDIEHCRSSENVQLNCVNFLTTLSVTVQNLQF